MKPTEVLKARIPKITGKQESEEMPTLLDILRQRNRDLEARKYRTILLRRIRRA